jgi:hypothetical protein
LDAAFPDWLALHAFGRWALGGGIRLRSLKPLDHLLIRAMGRSSGDIEKRSGWGLRFVTQARH